MTKIVVLFIAVFFFRIMLPRRQRRSNITVTPYGSVFDVEVPADVACSELHPRSGKHERMFGRSTRSSVQSSMAESQTGLCAEVRAPSLTSAISATKGGSARSSSGARLNRLLKPQKADCSQTKVLSG